MAANNDYFIRFGSNAKDFAGHLESDLKSARNVIKLLRNDLVYLNKDLSATGRVRAALAGDATRPTKTGAQPAIDSGKLAGDMARLDDNLSGLLVSLEAVVGGLRMTTSEIGKMPGQISEAVANALRAVKAQQNIAEGKGPHVDPNKRTFQTPGVGTEPVGARKDAAFASAMAQANRLAAEKKTISGVTPGAIDKAGADRIVRAIEKQTDKLVKKGVVARPGEVDTPTTSATVSTKAPKVDRAHIEAEVRKVLGNVGEDVIQAAVGQIMGAAQTAATAAVTAPVKRSSKENKALAAAVRSSRPAISDEDMRLINSPGDTGFSERLGRKKDDYTLAELHQMADAYERLGIAVQRTARMSKEDLGKSLTGAFGQFSSLYPGGEKDFQVGKTTKAPQETKDLLGSFDQLEIDARQAAIALRQLKTAGTGRQPKPNLDREGNAVPTYGVTSGPGIFPWDQVGSPVTRQGTPQELLDTYRLLNSSKTRQMPRAVAGAEDETFNPFDPIHKIQQGSTPGEKALAEAMRARLRDIRLATVEVDKFGGELHSLNEAIARNERFIESAEARIAQAQKAGIPVGPDALTAGLDDRRLRDAGFGKQLDDPKYGIDRLVKALSTDPERLEQAMTTVRDQYARDYTDIMGRAQAAGVNPASPAYQAAREARTPDRDTFLEAERVRAEEATRNNVSTFRELKQALVEGVARVGDPKNRIPGLTYSGDRLIASGGQSREDFAELQRAINHLASVEEDTLRARSGGYHASYADNITGRSAEDMADLEKMEDRFANAAQRFAHRIEAINPEARVAGTHEGKQIYGGLAPTVEELTGRRPQDERQVAEDELRRTARERAGLDAKNATANDEQKATILAADIARAQRKLKTAVDARTKAEETLKAAEESAAAAYNALSKDQRAEVDRQRGIADAADTKAKSAQRELDELENIKNRYHAPQDETEAADSRRLAAERVGFQGPAGTKIPDIEFQRKQKEIQDRLNAAQSEAATARNAARRMGQEVVVEPPTEKALEEADQLRKRAKSAARVIKAQEKIAAKLEAELAALPRATSTVQGKRVTLDKEGRDVRESGAASVESLKRDLRNQLADVSGAIAKAKQQLLTDGPVQTDVGRRVDYLESSNTRYLGPETDVRKATVQGAADAAKTVAQLEKEIADLNGRAEKLVKTEEKEVVAKTADVKVTEQVVRATNAAITAKRQQIEDLKAQGPHTQAELNPLLEKRRAMAKDDPEYAQLDADIKALQARKTAKHKLQKELRDMEAGGDGTGDGGTRRTGQGGADSGGSNILRSILAELKALHTTIKGGVKVTETEGADGTKTARVTAAGAAATTAAARPAGADAALLAQIAAKRSTLRGTVDKKLDDRIAEEEARAAQRVADANTKAATAERNRARQAEVLGAATRALNADTKAEIETLRKLTAAYGKAAEGAEKEAAAVAVANQQTKVAGAIDRDLARQNIRSTDRRQGIKAVLNDAGPKLGAGEFEGILRSSSAGQAFSGQGEEWGQQMGLGAQDGFARVFGGGSSFWGRVLHTTGTFVVRNFAAGFVFGLTNMLQQVLQQGLLAEQTFIRVRSALESTGKSLGNIRSDLQGISNKYGVDLNDTYEAAAGLAGLFENENDLAAGTEVVAQLQLISGGALNAAEATGVLASSLSAFQRQSKEQIGNFLPEDNLAAVSKIADVLTVIQNTLGVNIETAAEGASRLAGLASQMQLSFEETAVFSAQIAKQTNQTGAGAGEQFSRILSQASTSRGRGAILGAFGTESDVGRSLAAGDYGSTFKGIIAGWDGLTESQKNNLRASLAGQRQAAAFNALMNDGSKVLDTLARAESARGDATARSAELVQTFNKRIATFNTQLQTLASNLIQAGLLDFLGLVLVAATAVLDVVNKVLTAFNQFADSNGAIDWLRSFVAVLVGAAIAFKAIQVGARGFSGALRTFQASQEPGGRFGPAPIVSAGIRDTQRTTAPGPIRPGYSAFGRPLGPATQAASGARAPLTRGLAFTTDRTVGAASSFVARQLTNLGSRIGPVGDEATTLRQRLGKLSTTVGAAGTRIVDRGREGLAGVGSGRSIVGSGLTGLATKFAQEAELAAQRAAHSRSVYADQRKYAGYEGPTAAANRANMERRIEARGQDVATRTAAPDARLVASARANELVARSAGAASVASSKVAAGFSRVAQSGGLLDGAMIGIGILIASMFSSMQRHAEQASSWKKGIEGLTASMKEANDETEISTFKGPTDETLTNQNKKLEESSWWTKGTTLLSPSTAANILSGGRIGKDPVQAAREEIGLTDDGTEMQGTRFADDLIKSTKEKMDGVADSAKEIDEKSKDAYATIEEQSKAIGKSDLSDAQKQAAIANLERARAAIADQAAAMAAIAAGAKSVLGLTVGEVQAMQEYVSVVTSLNGQINANGLDLGPLLQTLREDTGAAYATPDLKRALETIGDPTSSSIDILIANRKLLKEEIIQLQEQWRKKLDAGDEEGAADAKSALLSTIQQYGAANDGIFDAITQTAASLSAEAEASGNGDKAIAVYGDAAKKAQRIFRKETQNMRKEYRRVKLAWLAIAAQSNRVSQMLGEEGPDFDINPQDFKKAFNRGKGQAARQRQQRERMEGLFDAAFEKVVFNATKNISLKISRTVDAQERAALTASRDAIILGLINAANSGEKIPGIPKNLYKFGPGAITPQEQLDAEMTANQSRLSAAESMEDAGNTAAQNAAALRQAQLGVAQAWADARGDAVKSAQIQVAIAKATIAAARADLAAATTADETNSARIAILNAQAQLIAAHAAVQASQQDLVQSQYDVTIALAEAAGHTVEAARRTLAAARAGLAAALKKSGGEATAEVNAARVQAIQAEAALRDARLQDDLDTIDFNLEMGKMTQASAIAALQEILKTRDLTRDQRRQLLLQIKGMKDEMADSQWNFGDIKLPTPYQMRRYIEGRRQQFRGEMDAAAAGGSGGSGGGGGGFGYGGTRPGDDVIDRPHQQDQRSITHVQIDIDGADIGMIRKVLREVVGSSASINTRTTGARRN